MIASVRVRLLRDRVDSTHPILLTNRSDVRWLSGFSGSNGWVLIVGDARLLITDGRYMDQASAQTRHHGFECEIVETRATSQMVEAVSSRHRGTINVRAADLDYAIARNLIEAGLDISDEGQRIADCRRVKDATELEAIAQAANIADRALSEVLDLVEHGNSERDLRDELEYRMRRLGADGPSYDTIVASGPDHSARPHHQPERRVLRPGDAVVIDVGALLDGYHSDMTRTVFIGDPSPELERLYRIVHSAQAEGLAAVRAGVAGASVDAACRAIFEAEGLLDLYPHGTGHGVGLDIHEEPFLGSRCTTSLLAGEVVTVEPGLYRGGLGGVRIEDLVLVTDDGCRILTQHPKEMRCLR